MKKYIIDTNALISFVTDRSPAQQSIVSPLFESASRLKCTLVCHQFVLTEFVFVMDKVYGTPKETINSMVRDFITMPGVELYQQTDFSLLLSFWPSKIADFGDALLAATGKAIKGSTIVTFDEKFKSALKKLGLESL
jgi:predicted nucleic-acid-binding protein